MVEFISFVQEFGDFLSILGKIRRDCLIVVVGLLEIGEQSNGCLVGWIVIGKQNRLGNFLRVAIATVLDELLCLS